MGYQEPRGDGEAPRDSVVDDPEKGEVPEAGDEPMAVTTLSEQELRGDAVLLMRSPENAQRLAEAIRELEADKGVERPLAE
ncbi:type II toxin-antitoxin system prevent-host-death family antitoxin [Nocardiopsis sp. CA-288880]|uniref:type II toxin-antitoxin system prevent-host-death family antitoxin n=1 Tax=Nocardiopsis sp. CA-288880 TaxID=3239995 RepID=UPI003D9710E9